MRISNQNTSDLMQPLLPGNTQNNPTGMDRLIKRGEDLTDKPLVKLASAVTLSPFSMVIIPLTLPLATFAYGTSLLNNVVQSQTNMPSSFKGAMEKFKNKTNDKIATSLTLLNPLTLFMGSRTTGKSAKERWSVTKNDLISGIDSLATATPISK